MYARQLIKRQTFCELSRSTYKNQATCIKQLTTCLQKIPPTQSHIVNISTLNSSNLMVWHFRYDTNRSFHSSSNFWDKSKVEDSLKQKQNTKPVDISDSNKVVVKPSLWSRFVDEIKHYYHGFRLLGLDVRIACGTVWKYLNGNPVMRREQRQFTRAVSDIFRLAPFSVFIIIPLAELALPFALKLFPNMLPYTFETTSKKQSRLKKELAVKLEMSKFLQDAMEDIAIRAKKSAKKGSAAKDLISFLEKIRTNEEEPSNEEIMKHAKFFEDEITLYNLSRDQLMALCKMLKIPAVGHNAALRLMLELRLSSLAADDKMIQEEGTNSLTTEELVAACQERGMRALGMSRARLETQLSEWIDLHLNSNVSPSLLLLSRVLYLPENVPMNHRVKAAISSLSEKTAEEAKVRASEINLERVDNTVLYKTTKQEVKDIATEKATEDALVVEETAESKPESRETIRKITQEDIDTLVRVLVQISGNMATLKEAKSELNDLREDMLEYQTDVKSLKEQLATDQDTIIKKDTKASQRIHKRLKKLVKRMDNIVNDLEKGGENPLSAKRLSFNDIDNSFCRIDKTYKENGKER